jgi:phosphoribosylanthranilate isomerase
MARVKICGITRSEDLQAACAAGADALGFVFYAKSPRNLSIEQAAALLTHLPPFVQSVGLFVDAEPEYIKMVLEAAPLDLLQFHGNETPDECRAFGRPYIKVVRMKPCIDLVKYCADFYDARALLLDAFVPGIPGGTGERFDWNLIHGGLPKPIVLSGGLNPDNVALAVKTVQPWAVDVSSGVEAAPGIKDAAKVAAFIAQAKGLSG